MTRKSTFNVMSAMMAVAAIVFGVAATAPAKVIFDGGVDGTGTDFGDASNWLDPDTLLRRFPDVGEEMRTGAGVTVNVNAAYNMGGPFKPGLDNVGVFTVNVPSGGSLTILDLSVGVHSSGTSTLNINGGTINATRELFLPDTGGDGLTEVIVSDGGTLIVANGVPSWKNPSTGNILLSVVGSNNIVQLGKKADRFMEFGTTSDTDNLWTLSFTADANGISTVEVGDVVINPNARLEVDLTAWTPSATTLTLIDGWALDDPKGLQAGETFGTPTITGLPGGWSASVSYDLANDDVLLTIVPEPASLGLGGLTVLARRRV